MKQTTHNGINYINLTKHDITEVSTGITIPKSGIVVRCTTNRKRVSKQSNLPIYKTISGDIDYLPEPKPNTIYIISALALNCKDKDRTDVVAPGQVQKDEHGKILGCTGFRL